MNKQTISGMALKYKNKMSLMNKLKHNRINYV